MSKYSFLCFDMDGVIFSSRAFIGIAYQKAVESFNKRAGAKIAIPDTNTILAEVGRPAHELFEKLFPHLNEADRRANANNSNIYGTRDVGVCCQLRLVPDGPGRGAD